MSSDKAVLVLEDGSRFPGLAWGAKGECVGEVVFSTGMTGYQETITDPSYAGQILVSTAPHIGNTGLNDEDAESEKIWIEGWVARDPSRVSSNFRSNRSLNAELEHNGVVGICSVDTRAITLRLRERGVLRGGIFSGKLLEIDKDEQLARVTRAPEMSGQNLSEQVSVKSMRVLKAVGKNIGRLAVLDLGVKNSTLHHLAARGFEVHVLPWNADYREILSIGPVGLFYSNGPGDPSASDDQVELLRKALEDSLPFFGICFGNQLLGRAVGLPTYKLKYGHRGINQPVLDIESGRVEITAQNHGFAVEASVEKVFESSQGFGPVRVSHVSLSDGIVQGIALVDRPAFSVQFHPEAAAGPHDSTHLFDKFRNLVLQHKPGSEGETP